MDVGSEKSVCADKELKSVPHPAECVSINSQTMSVVDFSPFLAPDSPAK